MNFGAHRQGLLAWYIELAKQPATKAYAWRRVNEMAKACPDLYADLPKKLTEAMQKAQEGPAPGAGEANASAAGAREGKA